MAQDKRQPRITISQDGPYLVSGSVPLREKIIVPKGRKYELQPGREWPQGESYALCRCGQSRNAPFCDGSHQAGYCGTETALRTSYDDRAQLYPGTDLDLLDDGRCAFARFCHQEKGIAWDLIRKSDMSDYKAEAIEAANTCPSGRLTAVEKDGNRHEPDYEPLVEIVQDPQEGVSAGIFVKGGIVVESADGTEYEVRNRIALCRCGRSRNKPFCDATHIPVHYRDKKP